MQVRERFEEAGGRVYEFAAAEGLNVHPNGVSLVMPQTEATQRSTGNGASASGNGTPGETLPGLHTCPVKVWTLRTILTLKGCASCEGAWCSRLMSNPGSHDSLMSPLKVSPMRCALQDSELTLLCMQMLMRRASAGAC